MLISLRPLFVKEVCNLFPNEFPFHFDVKENWGSGDSMRFLSLSRERNQKSRDVSWQKGQKWQNEVEESRILVRCNIQL